MKYHIICFLLLLISLCSNAQIRLIDGADGSPVQAASVFIDGGKCVGVSDSNGTLPLPKGYTGTVTVQHLNYTGKEFRADTVSNNTVRLTPYTYAIPEVTAKYERPDYMVMTVYARSYDITDSIPSSFGEGMFNFYVPMGKGRIRRKALAVRRVSTSHNDDDEHSGGTTNGYWPRIEKRTLLDEFRKKGIEPLSATEGVARRGRRGKIMCVKRDIAAQTLTVYTDSLCMGEESAKINFFGIKLRFKGFKDGETYYTGNGSPTLADMICKYNYISMSMEYPRKKLKEMNSESFDELYVTGISYASKKEMKAAMKAEEQRTVTVPQGIPPLSAPLAEAVSRMK